MIGPKYLLGEAILAQTSLMNDNAAFLQMGIKSHTRVRGLEFDQTILSDAPGRSGPN